MSQASNVMCVFLWRMMLENEEGTSLSLCALLSCLLFFVKGMHVLKSERYPDYEKSLCSD